MIHILDPFDDYWGCVGTCEDTHESFNQNDDYEFHVPVVLVLVLLNNSYLILVPFKSLNL